MAKIVLGKKERYFLSNKLYLIINGSICAYDIFENGKVLPKETCFKKGEIIGNFFQYLPTDYFPLPLPDTEIEVVAMEDNTIIEEFSFEAKNISINLGLSKIIVQLLKENIFKLFYHLYDKKGYLLAILKFDADDKGMLLKEQIHYDNFLMSKSQFYNVYTILKEERYLKENGKNIQLNLKKIDKYLSESFLKV